MNIRRLQVKRALDKIIKNRLKSGLIPTQKNMMYSLIEWFADRLPGQPTFKPRAQEYRQRSDASGYNVMLEEIEDDLETIYASLLRQNRALIDDFTYFERERVYTLSEIQELSERVRDAISECVNTNPYMFSINEHFDSFERIDLSKTTAEVDLDRTVVRLKSMPEETSKVDLQDKGIELTALAPQDAIVEDEEISPLENCLDDYLNTSWSHRVKTDSGDEPVTATLTLDLDGTHEISQIEVVPNSPTQMYLQLYYSYQGDWQELDVENNTLLRQKRWSFVPFRADRLRFELSKEHAELVEGGVYNFGLKNISLYKTNHAKTGRLVTRKIAAEPENNRDLDVEYVYLEADEHLPPETEIDYYLQIDSSDAPELPVSPMNREDPEHEQKVSVHNTESMTKTFSVSPGTVSTHSTSHGLDFYTAAELAYEPIHGEIDIFRGVDRWKREWYIYRRISDHSASLADWNLPPVDEEQIDVDYVDEISTTGDSDTNYRFTTWIYCDEVEQVTTDTIPYPEYSPIDDGRNTALYVNTRRMNRHPTDDEHYVYQIRLEQGWNRVVFVGYTGDEDNPDHDYPVELNLDFSDASHEERRAHRDSMTQVSLYELRHGKGYGEDNYFATDENRVVFADDTENSYRAEYRYAFDEIDHVIVTADLRSDSPFVTPEIRELRINMGY